MAITCVDFRAQGGKADHPSRPRRRRRLRLALEALESRVVLDTTITQYYTPANVWPVGSLLGAPNGQAWYTRISDPTIGHIKTDGTIDEMTDLYLQINVAVALQTDPAGNLWVGDIRAGDEDRLARLTTDGQVKLITDFSNILSTVNSQAAAPTAFLPLARFLHTGPAVMVGVNQDDSFSLFNLPSTSINARSLGPDWALQIAQAADGTFWYPDGDGVTRLTRDGQTTRFQLPDTDPHHYVGSIALGGDGNMWIRVDRFDDSIPIAVADSIGRINADGTITEFSLAADGAHPLLSRLISSTDGSVWFDEQGVSDNFTPLPNTHRLGKVSDTGAITEYALPNGNDSFFSSVGPDGVIWYTQPFTVQDGVPQVSVVNKVSIHALPFGGPDHVAVTQGSTTQTPVAEVQLPNPDGAHASVDLGNGTTAAGTLAPKPDGSFTVTAPIFYNVSGSYLVHVSVVDGSGVQALFHTTATVTPGPNEKYVDQLYHDLLGRVPDDGGLTFWTTALDNGLPRSALAAVLQNAPEARKGQVDQLYQSLLGRAADAAGEQFWVNFLTDSKMGTGPLNAGVPSAFSSPGGSIDAVRAFFLASPEFQQQGGGTVADYVGRLYQQLLGRIADAQGEVFWGTQIKNTSALAVVYALTRSDEAARHAATLDLQNTLRRTADAGGVAFFASAIVHGVPSEVIERALLASDEFFQKVGASNTVLP